jgi:hypothetical protein
MATGSVLGTGGAAFGQRASEAEVALNAEYVNKFPFRDSGLWWGQSVNAVGMVKSSELTWNPSYSWLFRFYPRYHVTDKLSLRLKVGLGIEWTNADDTSTQREPRWEDIWFDAVYSPGYTERWSQISISPSLRLVIPSSLESRAQSLYLGVGPGFSLKRTVQLPWRMTLDLAYGFRYVKNLNRYTTVQFQAPSIAACGGTAGEGACGQFLHTGDLVPSHEFFNTLQAELGITRKLKASVMVLFRNQLLYGASPATVATAGGETLTVGDDPQNNVGQRAAIWYLIEASYEIHPIVTLGLAVSTLNPQLSQESSYNTPFFNRYTEFGLNTSIALDQIVARVDRKIRSRRASTK